MVSVDMLKKNVKETKDRVKPEPKHFIIHYLCGSADSPHGFLGSNLFHIVTDKHGKTTRWYEAVDSETELKSHREYYDNLLSHPHSKFMKQPSHLFHSFESFLEYSRCSCGKHGADGKQSFHGETSQK